MVMGYFPFQSLRFFSFIAEITRYPVRYPIANHASIDYRLLFVEFCNKKQTALKTACPYDDVQLIYY